MSVKYNSQEIFNMETGLGQTCNIEQTTMAPCFTACP